MVQIPNNVQMRFTIKSRSRKLDAITNTTLKNKTKQEQKLLILILNTNTTAKGIVI